MADFTQSQVTLISHQALTHPGSIVGSAQSVASYISAVVSIWHANVETVANAEGVRYKIQGSPMSSGNEDWTDLFEWITGTTSAETETLTATEPQAETDLAVAATANFEVGDVVYVQDTGTLADSEWGEVEEVVSNVSVNLLDGLANAKDSSDVLWDQAERIAVEINCAGLSRIRVVVVHRAATGSDVHCRVETLFATDLE